MASDKPKTKPRPKSNLQTTQAKKLAQKDTVLVKMSRSQLAKFKLWLKEHQKNGPITTYKPEYCAGVIAFFKKKCERPFEIMEVVAKDKWGNVITDKKTGQPMYYNERVPNLPPYLVDYAMEIGVNVRTLQDWAAAHPAFNLALEHARELRTSMLVNNGLTGLYNPNSWIFAAKNLSGMTDRTDITSKGESVFNVKLSRFDKPEETEDLNPEHNKQIKNNNFLR